MNGFPKCDCVKTSEWTPTGGLRLEDNSQRNLETVVCIDE